MRRQTAFKIGLVICLLSFILGIANYRYLPDVMATHFGINNMPNGFSSKNMALFGLPSMMLLLYGFAYFITLRDPKRYNQNEKVINFILLAIPLFIFLSSVVIIYINLGYQVDVEALMTGALGMIFIIIGNYMPKIKQNYTLGIRLPWTLHDVENWNKTHRLGGIVWFVGGVFILMSMVMAHQYLSVLIPATIVVMVGIPSIYSYVLFRQT